MKLLPALLPLLLLPATAEAKAPRGSKLRVPDTMVNAGTSTGSRILYLNRCLGGCELSPGFEDSRSNHSSIIKNSRNLSEFKHSEEDWREVVDCVRQLYAPFEIKVVDEDPGQADHFEAMVAGTAVEAGFLGAGGVSPFTCGVIENAITFSFASNYENMRTLCYVVGQESAHALGLDHELECTDPLTYLPGCPIKAFQDIDAPCGEYNERPCECGGDTQNSFQYIERLFGVGLVPEVQIQTPQDEQSVAIGFEIRARATDDIETTHSELWIDNQLAQSLDAAPYKYQAPSTLGPGEHLIEVRVYDDRELYGSQSISIDQAPCTSNYQCEFSYLCLGGACVLGPGNATGLGDSCDENEQCQSQLCARERNLPSVCTAFCDLETQSCPYSFECKSSVSGQRLCMPITPEGGGGFCSSGGQSPGAEWGLLLFCLLYGTRRVHGIRGN